MRLGIVGSGMIVNDVLPILKELDIEIFGISGTERSKQKLIELKEIFSIEKVFTDYENMLESQEIDTVYIGIPNHLHYEYSKKALLFGKNVICEKPFTLNMDQLIEIKELAEEKNLILIEAITNQYLKNYEYIKSNLKRIGDIKIIECNYSQYSSRYDAFKKGIILPTFDPQKGGGALMDINIYNIHFVVGLLGRPNRVEYVANIDNEIDTSGILIMEYETTKVVCIGAKDSTSEIRTTVQGEKGSFVVNGATNSIPSVMENIFGDRKVFNINEHEHRMYSEFKEFRRIIDEKDLKSAKDRMNHSLLVMEIVDKARMI